MPIYKQSGNKLLPTNEKKIDLEKSIQAVVEENLNEIFGLSFVSSEFSLNNLRMDTLAFDEENKSFVVIELKKVESFSVIDQGFAYLALLLNNKADFVLKYNEKCHENLGKDDIDWSQSKVIFIASSFTKYQQEAIGFQDLPIELWEVKKYDQDLLAFNQVKASEKSASIKTITKSKYFEKVSREIKQYSLNDHIKPTWNTTKELFDELSQQILELDSTFEIKPVKSYIGFRIGSKNVVNVKPRGSKIIIELLRTQPKDLKDPEKKVSYYKNSFKYFNQHVSLFDIVTEDDINYAMLLIKQVYKKFSE